LNETQPEPSNLIMGRSHDITISGFDLDRIEAEARYWRIRAERAEEKIKRAGEFVAMLSETVRLQQIDIEDLNKKLKAKTTTPTDK